MWVGKTGMKASNQVQPFPGAMTLPMTHAQEAVWLSTLPHLQHCPELGRWSQTKQWPEGVAASSRFTPWALDHAVH